MTPLYEFGAGLSYTSFEMASTAATVALDASGAQVCVDVTNSGATASPVVITVFAVPNKLGAPPTIVPNRKLVAFDRTQLSPKEQTKVSIANARNCRHLLTIAYAGLVARCALI